MIHSGHSQTKHKTVSFQHRSGRRWVERILKWHQAINDLEEESTVFLCLKMKGGCPFVIENLGDSGWLRMFDLGKGKVLIKFQHNVLQFLTTILPSINLILACFFCSLGILYFPLMHLTAPKFRTRPLSRVPN